MTLLRWLKDGLAERGEIPAAEVWLDRPMRHSNGPPATAILPPHRKSPDLISYVVPHIQNVYERSGIKQNEEDMNVIYIKSGLPFQFLFGEGFMELVHIDGLGSLPSPRREALFLTLQ